MARVFSFLALVALASCTTTRVNDDEREERRAPLDQCLGEDGSLTAEQLAHVRAVWEQIARGVPIEHITPIAFHHNARGACTREWWAPVEPMPVCDGDQTMRTWPWLMKAGPVLFDVAKGTWSTRAIGDEVWIVDDHVVLRRFPASDPENLLPYGDIELEVADGPNRKLAGFPERVLDDDRAIVRADPIEHLVDTRTGRVLLEIAPKTKTPRSVSGVVVARDMIAALDFGEATWTAFALDVRGRHIAQVQAQPSNVAMPHATRDGAVLLVAWQPPELEAILVRDGRVAMRRKEKLEGIALSSRDDVIAAAEGMTVAVGLGATLIVLRDDAPRIVLDTLNRRDTRRSVKPLHVLTGGNVVLATVDGTGVDGVIVLDARTNSELARLSDSQGARLFDDGKRALLLDARAQNQDYAVVIDGATAAISRGKVGEAKVGRFTLRTFAGVLDPARACSARALAKMPPLLRFGDQAVLPAALVR